MSALALRLFPKAPVEAVAEFETFVSVAMFCGLGPADVGERSVA